MKPLNKGFLTIVMLIGVTTLALVYVENKNQAVATVIPVPAVSNDELVVIDTKLIQDKVLQGSDGTVSVALTLTGANIENAIDVQQQPVDLVVVLDRSGSMEGQKIVDARQAVIGLMERLSPRDRMAVITYSNGVERVSPLTYMTNANRQNLAARVRMIRPGGGTNLGAGLDFGISSFSSLSSVKSSDDAGRQRKIILISDGLANQGVTDPYSLGRMAANGTESRLAVSTVGVGNEFNELLMTTIADHGAGNYYFLENPIAFARVFEKEFEMTRNIVAGGLEIRIPLGDGVQLIDAGGYPISREGNYAVIKPGDLLAGQQRKIFLTYQVPSHKAASYTLGSVHVNYLHNGVKQGVSNNQLLTVFCVQDQKAVVASIDEEAWSEQVVKEDYNKLKDNVASSIRKGRKEEALKTIEEYEVRNRSLNSSVGSRAVAENLEGEVQSLKQSVEDTFTGAPAAVAEKKKNQAKILQYESYQIRRDKK
ncbi:vWA domain-containing protein [Desulfosediminicola flagellatus]|uniref:vWA domain-containing protein n=1 Tax=Desulfosediminicola flagellatus TaxID=2569541 RepID=UPI0010AD332C|nr:VWA domain-containing protein [Desulfosediminicola flagellatus]